MLLIKALVVLCLIPVAVFLWALLIGAVRRW